MRIGQPLHAAEPYEAADGSLDIESIAAHESNDIRGLHFLIFFCNLRTDSSPPDPFGMNRGSRRQSRLVVRMAVALRSRRTASVLVESATTSFRVNVLPVRAA